MPQAWTEQQTNEFYDHIRRGQLGYISIEQRFQYYQVNDTERATAYCAERHPNSYLIYPPAGRLYLRRLLLASQDDRDAYVECLDHLPWPVGDGQTSAVFTEAEFQDLMDHLGHHATFARMFQWTKDYEQYGPVVVSV